MILQHILKTIKSSLVVFCVLVGAGCTSKKSPDVEIIYENKKAIGISFSSSLATTEAKIFVQHQLDTPMLGDFLKYGDSVIFKPVIPFSKGSTYILYQNKQEVGRISIPLLENVVAPEVLAVYPTTAVVPENLLKMYFVFSQPMQEVEDALNFISLTDMDTGEEVDAFLALPTELWNKEHTQLTLWFDPGRIKTHLIPNKEKGLPIVQGKSYILSVGKSFKDAQGAFLAKAFTKEFKVGPRDAHKPKPTEWELYVAIDSLRIHFKEPMDAIVALESFQILNSKKEVVTGDFKLTQEESTLLFYPQYPFALGGYTLLIESRLEDLAGNNLNHPFDNDLNKLEKQEFAKTKKLQFIIE